MHGIYNGFLWIKQHCNTRSWVQFPGKMCADIIYLYIYITFMHLADAFIQSDLQCIQAIHFLSVCVFPGNRTHNLCTANAML